MNLTRRQAILGALTLPLAAKASPEYEDGAALFSSAHPDCWANEAAADLSPASIEMLDVEIAAAFEPGAHVQAMLAEAYRQTAAVIYANTMNEAMPPRPGLNILARARNR